MLEAAFAFELPLRYDDMATNNAQPEVQSPGLDHGSQALTHVQRIRPQHPFYLLPAELILDIILTYPVNAALTPP